MTSAQEGHFGLAVDDVTVGELLRDAVAQAPDRTALIVGARNPADRRRWTYAELFAEAEQMANALLARFEPGQPVAIWAHNVPHWVPLQLSLALAGLPMVAMMPSLSREEARFILERSGAAACFTVPAYRDSPLLDIASELADGLPALQEVTSFDDWDAVKATADPGQALPSVEPDATLQIQYTSGTTGFPKGALLTHRRIVANVRRVAERAALGDGPVFVSPSLLCHVAGSVTNTLLSVAVRGTLSPMSEWDPGLQLELIETERATMTAAVPTMMLAVLAHPDFDRRDLSSLERIILGAATVPADLVRTLEARLGVNVLTMYGQTEAGPVLTMVHHDDAPEDKAETVGTVLDGWEARIVDRDTKEPLPPGDAVGEIVCRGPMTMAGYLNDPEQTAKTIDADGWLHTGDLGTMDERGYFRVVGRLSEMIIRGGNNVYPRQVEDVLLRHDSVAEVAVIGLPDEYLGESVAAFVRPAEGRVVDREALLAHARESLARYKIPDHWFLVEAFPLTPTSKVRKNVLKEEWERDQHTAL